MDVQLVHQILRWKPRSGWGKLLVLITFEQGAPKFVKRIEGEETVLLPGWSEHVQRRQHES